MAAALTGGLAAPQASAAAAPSAASHPVARKCTKVQVTGKTVAVRRPPDSAPNPVAKPDSPVVRYIHRGDILTTCVTAIARTDNGRPAYTKCGRGGWTWHVVQGGQIPATCTKRL
ncbi:hypothetical protein [Streptomyces sp. NPDC001450]